MKFPDKNRSPKPAIPERCSQCEYYQPTWKYRTCRFVRCAYDLPHKNVFRKNPLREDHVYHKKKRKKHKSNHA